MQTFLQQLKWYIPGVLIGGIAGYLYYQFLGCKEHCVLSSSSTNSMLYIATMGGLLNYMLKPQQNETKKDKSDKDK